MQELYAVVAYGARYWFALLGVVILWRTLTWLKNETRITRRTRRSLPDHGLIGEWVVLETGVGKLQEGDVLSAMRDGVIGSAAGCDVRLPSEDVPAKAARFELRPDGLYVRPFKRGILTVDSEPVQRVAILRHGATLTVGETTLQLLLFAGVLLKGERVVRTRNKKPAPQETITLPEPAMTVTRRPKRKGKHETQTPTTL